MRIRLKYTLLKLLIPFLTECASECCLGCVAASLGNKWKVLGRELGITDPEIENISSDSNQQREHGYQVLLKWKNCHGKLALVSELSTALKTVQLSNVADELHKHMQEKHGNAQ